ncbi:MAG: ABC transporter ATP-binding protein [Eubacteriales bacterium]
MSEVINVKNLIKSYDKKIVLNNISLTIYKGEFICILGTSGCGKTTLLNSIGGFIKKDSGHIMMNNREITKPVKDCVMVFQDFDQLFPWMTLEANIAFVLKNSNIRYTKKEVDEISSKYIRLVKLNGFEKFYPHQLSGGMKQRTAIARSLVTFPEVLLMDEPFGSLDIQTKNALHETLLNIWKETKTTIIFVTHDVREALKLSDRMVIIKEAAISRIIHNQDKLITDKKVEEITSLL